MRIGIITMISDNYGNRLQNYALQEVLKYLGNSVETLNNPWEKEYKPFLGFICFYLKKIAFTITKRPQRFKRKLGFVDFNRKYIHFSKFWLNKEKDKIKANKYYDLFICGSDQIWNSEAKEIDGKYFANFADPLKRTSYAASFGLNKIMEERKDEFKQYLLGMNYISVREQSAVRIVEDLILQIPDYHIDPTLLLTSNEWNKLANMYTSSKKKYIFCYFLGKPTENLYSRLQDYAENNGLDIASIWNIENGTHNYVEPSEFLSLIKNAEFVLTDSFHGTAFSIIYHKPFFTFSRNGVRTSMDTRVVSLLDLLKLTDRFEPQDINLNNIYNINFSNADCILNKERKKALDYLRLISK